MQSFHFPQHVHFDWNKVFQWCMLRQTKTCHFGSFQSEIVFLHGLTEPPRVAVSIFFAPSPTVELPMWNIFPTVQLKVSDKEMYGRLVLTRRLPTPPRKQGHSGDCRIQLNQPATCTIFCQDGQVQDKIQYFVSVLQTKISVCANPMAKEKFPLHFLFWKNNTLPS